MFVTHTFRIPYDEELYNELRMMQREAASVWNDIVREATSYYVTCKKWLSKTEIQSIRKQTYDLHSQTVQAIADKYVAVGTMPEEDISLVLFTKQKSIVM